MTDIPQQLSVVALGARDVDGLRDFYASFGWRARPRQGAFYRFELAGATLMLFPLAELAEVVGLTPAPEGEFRGTVNAMVVGSEDEAAAVLAKAVELGGRHLSDVTRRPWGSSTAYFADPEANVWEIAVLPGARFDERGAVVWPGRER